MVAVLIRYPDAKLPRKGRGCTRRAIDAAGTRRDGMTIELETPARTTISGEQIAAIRYRIGKKLMAEVNRRSAQTEDSQGARRKRELISGRDV
jgi:hypothetical protein